MSAQNPLKTNLELLYPGQMESVYEKIMATIQSFQAELDRHHERRRMSEKDLLLITYPHQIQASPGSDEKPLELLAKFYNQRLKKGFSGLHILPFYPSTSDGGFAVSDYDEVDPAFGTWDDLQAFDDDMMFDFVFNHTSSQHHWFKEWLAENPKYQDYYHFFETRPEDNSDEKKQLDKVTRPRSSDLLTEYLQGDKKVYVWATFGPDQLDINFSNPEVLVEFVKILLLYVGRGATFLRLDAVPFLWKTLGTSCVHLPETHAIIQVFRSVLDLAAPQVQLVTESNVPHEENISYFGNSLNEAQMVYNFSLAPLILYSLVNQRSKQLQTWVNQLEPFPPSNCFFNFTATHDGIGVRPLEGILEQDEILNFVYKLKDKGGLVSYRSFDGVQRPYEVNITWASALSTSEKDRHVQKVLTSYAMSFVFPGVPGVYFHNLIGSHNWEDGVRASQHNRDINRRMMMENDLQAMINDSSFHQKVFEKTLELLETRRSHRVFHPEARFEQLESSDDLWVVRREFEGEKGLFVFNVTEKTVDAKPFVEGELGPFEYKWYIS